MCLIAALLLFTGHCLVRFAGPRLSIEYIRGTDGIWIAALSVLLLGAGVILLNFPLRVQSCRRQMAFAAVGMLLFTAAVSAVTPGFSDVTETVDFSGESTLILKTDGSGRTVRYRRIFPLLARKGEAFPYTTELPLKTQWLTGDACAVTYRSPDDGAVHQYIATFGDRSPASYYHVFSAVIGNWHADVPAGSGIALTVSDRAITVQAGNRTETFAPEDCVQFGTLALALCRDGLPQWTLVLGEDCRLEEGRADGGSILLCRVSMGKTAPIVFHL